MTMIQQIMRKTYDPWGPYSKEHWQKLVMEVIAAMREIPQQTIMQASDGGKKNITGNAGVFWRAIIDTTLQEAA